MLQLIIFFFAGLVTAIVLPGYQHVLSPEGNFESTASASGDNWFVREQGDLLCKASARHFAGRINVTDDKSLFFWFIESKEDPNNRPVIIWLNGGPGASSIVGLYGEVGPCVVNPQSDGTEASEYSWTDHANLLIIDQPAGVGLSTDTGNADPPHNLHLSSPDFLALLQVFYGEIFPQFAQNPLYIAGESFGGRYVPFYSAAMLREQQRNEAGALQVVPLAGIILVNALVDETQLSLGHFHLFCTSEPPNLVRFNESTCHAMEEAVPECARLGEICRRTYGLRACKEASEFCRNNLDVYFDEEVKAHRRSPYDLRHDCPEPPLCDVGGDDSHGSTSEFLNREEVQAALGFDAPVHFQSINFKLNGLWASDPEINVPTTSEISFLLDSGSDVPGHGKSNVSVLVINGEFDVSCNLPGTKRLYDELLWHGHEEYNAVQDFKSWFWVDETGLRQEGGLWKGIPGMNGGLQLVTVKDAGHMAPGDQRGAVASLVGRWVLGTGTDF